MSDMTISDPRPPQVVLRERLQVREPELRAALKDSGISSEQFIRALMTSAAINPDILACNFQSLWNACMRACRDGLLPDGTDGAIVPYKDKATWIPMYQGLLRRFRRSGQFKWITAGLVREGEEFFHFIDQDGEHFKHTPGESFTSAIKKVYALATTKDGGIFVAVMPMEEIDKIKRMSRATRDDSPWKSWPEEMMKKTVCVDCASIFRALAISCPKMTMIQILNCRPRRNCGRSAKPLHSLQNLSLRQRRVRRAAARRIRLTNPPPGSQPLTMILPPSTPL